MGGGYGWRLELQLLSMLVLTLSLRWHPYSHFAHALATFSASPCLHPNHSMLGSARPRRFHNRHAPLLSRLALHSSANLLVPDAADSDDQAVVVPAGKLPDSTAESIKRLQELRPGLRVYTDHTSVEKKKAPYWVSYRHGLQLDCCSLDQTLSSNSYNILPASKELAFGWDSALRNRISYWQHNDSSADTDYKPSLNQLHLQSNPYKAELSAALCTVHRSSFIARSVQQILTRKDSSRDGGSVTKVDNTPVTVADYVVQALVIDALSSQFPDDSFIAEEGMLMIHQWLSPS
jgi:hypothetical protein